MAGEIVHIDLVSTDFEKSKNFYGEIFGWRCTEVNVPGLPYMLWNPPSGPAGGFRRPSEADEPTPRVISTTFASRASLRRSKPLRGTVAM